VPDIAPFTSGLRGTPGLPGYPLSLRMDGRLAVVVGGGPLAVRRVADLRAAGAEVLVVARDISASLADLAARGLISTRQGGYEAADLDGAWLVLACTDQPAVNAAVAADAERLRLWCVPADDAAGPAALVPAAAPRDQPSSRGRVLVLGGARSGKSTTAEKFMAAYGEVEYVATGSLPDARDKEWAARVAEHRSRRPPHWRTTETIDLEQVLKSGDPAPVLVDCLSLWLARVMDECDAWTTGDDSAGDDSAGDDEGAAVTARVDRLLRSWRATSRHVVAVSNEVGCGVVPATASGRLYRDALGRLNAQIAADSDEVWFCTAGLPRRLR
jgi:adenosyl cobinamide kinase/adenosyl cobinamide phosphate guanylyltransferase